MLMYLRNDPYIVLPIGVQRYARGIHSSSCVLPRSFSSLLLDYCHLRKNKRPANERTLKR